MQHRATDPAGYAEQGDETIAILLGVAFFYLLITVPLGQVAAHLERKVAVFR